MPQTYSKPTAQDKIGEISGSLRNKRMAVGTWDLANIQEEQAVTLKYLLKNTSANTVCTCSQSDQSYLLRWKGKKEKGKKIEVFSLWFLITFPSLLNIYGNMQHCKKKKFKSRSGFKEIIPTEVVIQVDTEKNACPQRNFTYTSTIIS